MDAEITSDSTWDPAALKTGVAVVLGVLLGMKIALSIRKARVGLELKPVAEAASPVEVDFAEAGRVVVERRQAIYQAGLEAAEDAEKVWTLGRKIAAS